MTKAIERCGLKDEAQILLPAIAKRMNKLPFLETSEEVRMQLMDLLEVCLNSDKHQFIACMGEIGGMLGRCGADENPEMKSKMAAFSANLCTALPVNSGNYMRSAVLTLVQNLTH